MCFWKKIQQSASSLAEKITRISVFRLQLSKKEGFVFYLILITHPVNSWIKYTYTLGTILFGLGAVFCSATIIIMKVV